MAARFPGTVDGVEAALAALGSTPAAVAAALTAGGYGGLREDCCRCPVARYLLAVVEDAYDVMAGPLVVRLAVTVAFDGYSGVAVVLTLAPRPVRAFAEAFDQCLYPRLDLAVAA